MKCRNLTQEQGDPQTTLEGDTRVTAVQLYGSEQSWSLWERQLQEDETHGIPPRAQCVERILALRVEGLEVN